MFWKCLWREVNKFLNKCHQMVTMILNGLLRVEGRSCGDESSEWLERVLGIPGVHLVRGVRDHSPTMRDHSPTMIKNICAMSAM